MIHIYILGPASNWPQYFNRIIVEIMKIISARLLANDFYRTYGIKCLNGHFHDLTNYFIWIFMIKRRRGPLISDQDLLIFFSEGAHANSWYFLITYYNIVFSPFFIRLSSVGRFSRLISVCYFQPHGGWLRQFILVVSISAYCGE